MSAKRWSLSTLFVVAALSFVIGFASGFLAGSGTGLRWGTPAPETQEPSPRDSERAPKNMGEFSEGIKKAFEGSSVYGDR